MTARRKTLIALTLTAVCSFIILVLYIIPMSIDLRSLRADLEERRAALALQEHLAAQPEETERLTELAETAAELKKLFVTENDELRFFSALEDAAASVEVTQTIAPIAPSAQETLQNLPVALTVQGSFSDILRYLSRLERLEPLVVVRSLELIPESARGESSLSATVQASVFWEPHE